MSVSDLFGNLPDPFNTDPVAISAITITYNGSACWVQIEDDTFRTTTTGGTGVDLLLTLRNVTLQSFVASLNDQQGYTATVLPTFALMMGNAGLPIANVGAWCLIDTIQEINDSPYLSMAQSVLHQLFRTYNAAIEDSAASVAAIAQRTQISTADSIWLDDWGDLYGVDRNQGESDSDYSTRLTLQLIAPRTNNSAMRSIIKQVMGMNDVSVDDDTTPATTADATLQAAGQPYHRLNPFAFFVTLQLAEFGGFTGTFDNLSALVQEIKAWGTTYEPQIESLNTDTRTQSNDTQTWMDILLTSETFTDVIRDIASLAIADKWYESPQDTRLPWLLFVKPLGSSGSSKWNPDNPVDDGNAHRVLGPRLSGSDVAGLLVGKTKSNISWLRGMIDNWNDGSDIDMYSETFDLAAATDAFIDVLLSVEQYHGAIDNKLADALATLDTEHVTIGTHLFTLTDIFSPMLSPKARLLAVNDGNDFLTHMIELYQDTQS